MTFVALRTQIKTMLDALSGSGQPLQFVDDKHTSELSGFPAATFEPSGNENDYLTNTENIRKYAFQIIVHAEIPSGGVDNAVGVLAGAVDAIIAAFDQDYRLSGACDFAFATPSNWGRYKSGNASVLYAEINLVCVKSASIT